MSSFERARTGYEELAGRADQAIGSTATHRELGEIDQHYRDLGVLADLEATGRAVDGGARERLTAVLQAMEEHGAIRDFPLTTVGGAPAADRPAPERPGGAGGAPQPPPERAGRHGDFLSQPRPEAPPPPRVGDTWGPPAK